MSIYFLFLARATLCLFSPSSIPLIFVFSTLLFFPSLTHCHFLFCFIFLRAHRLLCYSSLTLSLVLFSHSPHSHASPSAVFTLPHSSSFPFSRFSLHLFYYLSAPYTLTPSLVARYLKLYFRPSLEYRVNLYLLPTILFSFHFSRQG